MTIPKLYVPKLFHQTWKNLNIPDCYDPAWRFSWFENMPGWKYRLWTDDDLIELAKPFGIDMNFLPPVSKADIGRYLIMYKHGGMYADLDYECLRNLEPLLEGHRFLSSWDSPEFYLGDRKKYSTYPRMINQAWLASEPEEPLWRTLAFEGYKRTIEGVHPIEKATAQGLVTELWDYNRGTLLSEKLMCPLDWRQGWAICQGTINTRNIHAIRQTAIDEGAYAITYWTHNWEAR